MTDFSDAISVATSGMKAQANRLRHVSVIGPCFGQVQPLNSIRSTFKHVQKLA